MSRVERNEANYPVRTEGNIRRRSSGRKTPGTGIGRVQAVVVAVLLILCLMGIVKIVTYIGSISRVHLSDEGLTHDKAYADMEVVHGIDVSEFQNEIDWKKVKSSEADFVFIRAGYRKGETGELAEDADFKEFIKGAEKSGIMVGAYFFSQALNEKEAVEEADYLLELVEPYDIDMPLVIDYELFEGGRVQQAVQAGEMPNASDYHDIVIAFCNRIEEAGYESAVYANYDMLTNYMDSTILDKEEVIWAAQYGGSCHVKGNYRYWQCAENAECGGIDGYIDHDIWYIDPGKVYSTYAKGKKEQVSIGDCKVKLDKTSYKLHNHRAKPKVQVTYDGRRLRKGSNYELSYVRNTTKGTGYAIIRGVSNYKDWIAVPFTIE